ncbi:hypothetical protein [Stenotrophomonas sp. Iso1]|nr:hypothetical protein [Stenotrophomonas sp. Iso1]
MEVFRFIHIFLASHSTPAVEKSPEDDRQQRGGLVVRLVKN